MNIVVAGSGSFGTALGNKLVENSNLNVNLLARREEVVCSINTTHINTRYFPNIKLNKNLRATSDVQILTEADVLFLAIPSGSVMQFVEENQGLIKSNTLIINLAKGFGEGKKTIIESLKDLLGNHICSLKGPSFAVELLNNHPSAFTFASEDETLFKVCEDITRDTNIYLDFSSDVRGVEILGILKNIYAITLGIMDAHFDSTNVRFMVLTRAFNEMRSAVIKLGGREETLFKYCGYGDFGLTTLNDLSRNRTLGLLIGKGFMTNDMVGNISIILEGKRSLVTVYEEIFKDSKEKNYNLISSLHALFTRRLDVPLFVRTILESSGKNLEPPRH